MLSWTTTGRPPLPQDGLLGFNRTTRALEYWDQALLAWTAVGGGGASCLDGIQAYDNAGAQPVPGGQINLDTVAFNSDATNYSLAGGFLTILNDGDYVIEGNLCVWDPAAAASNGWQASLMTSPAGLGTWALIVGSDAYNGTGRQPLLAGVAISIPFRALVTVGGGVGLDVALIGSPFPGSGTEQTFAQATHVAITRLC